MIPPSDVRPAAAEKLDLLRRLDRYRWWESLDDRRRCLQCGKMITGAQIAVEGGIDAFDPLRISCPTKGCSAVPMDWALPEDESDRTVPSASSEIDEPQDSLPDRGRRAGQQEGATVTDAEALAHSVLYRAWRAFTANRGKRSA